MSFRIENSILKKYLLDETETDADGFLRKEVTVPDDVTCIGKNAFESCNHLLSVHLPETVTEIDDYAFTHCTHMTAINLPDAVTRIGQGAFLFCQELQYCNVPPHLTEVGGTAFDYCTKLRKRPLAVIEGKLLFEPIQRNYVYLYEMQRIYLEHDYTAHVCSNVKYSLIAQMYFADLDRENTFAYLKKQFPKVFRSLIDDGETELIEQFITSGEFLTKRNIDKLMEYAVSKGQTEIQLLLLDCKNETIGYTDPAKRLKL